MVQWNANQQWMLTRKQQQAFVANLLQWVTDDGTVCNDSESFESTLQAQLDHFLNRLTIQIDNINEKYAWNVGEEQRKAWTVHVMCYLSPALSDDDLSSSMYSWYNHLSNLLFTLSMQSDWNLSIEQQQTYVANIFPCVPLPSTDDLIRRILKNYHLDHEQVQILCDETHLEHNEKVQAWYKKVLVFLQKKGLVVWATRKDSSISSEDLMQIALQELARSLPRFQYASRFTTWAYSVVTYSIQNIINKQPKSEKTTTPLDTETSESTEAPVKIPIIVQEKELLKIVSMILREHFSKEECEVFWRYVELLSLRKTSEETGTTVWFVRRTIKRIRTLLKSPPYNKIWEWFEPTEEENKEPDEPDEEPDEQRNDDRSD